MQERLRDRLAERRGEWRTEERVAGTPVDVVGRAPAGEATTRLTLVELEWRRADPADNAAKLFRHLDEGFAGDRPVRVVQVFTGFYDLVGGGHSSKRANAEFVGRAAAERLARVTYRAVDLALDPPKRGGDLPGGWREAVDEAAGDV